SLHRLVRSKAAVTWDPLALLAALYALLIAIGMWFDLWGVRNVTAARHFFFYLIYRFAFAAQMSILLLVPVALAVFSSRVLHYCGLAFLFATAAWHYAPYSIN